MDITFSKAQYRSLIKIVYLGDWFANAVRTDDTIKEFDELLCYVLANAGQAGHDCYVEYDPKMKKHFPSEKLEAELEGLIEEYNSSNFWEELVYRMAGRDLVGKYGEEAVKKMGHEERSEKEQAFLDKYYDEFEKNGLTHLEIK